MRRLLLIAALIPVGCGGSTAPPSHSVVVAPERAEVFAGATLQLTAEVLPEGSDQSIQWGTPGPGTISSSGLYQAPEFSGNVEDDLIVTVSATSSTHGVFATARITIPAASGLAAKGWEAFSLGDWDEAGLWFNRALDTFENYPPALAGFAWVDFRRGAVESAVAAWELLVEEGSTDALAGLVLVHSSADEPQAVISRGRQLLELDSDYEFLGDPGYSASDIRWLVARAGLDTGRYDVTAAQLQILAPGNALNPEAASFAEDALLLLESLQGSV